MNWLKEWWKTVTTEEYELTVWFVDQTVTDAEGNVTANKSKKVFSLSEVNKKTNTHFLGKDMDGNKIEIKTVEPFDFYLRKIY